MFERKCAGLYYCVKNNARKLKEAEEGKLRKAEIQMNTLNVKSHRKHCVKLRIGKAMSGINNVLLTLYAKTCYLLCVDCLGNVWLETR